LNSGVLCDLSDLGKVLATIVATRRQNYRRFHRLFLPLFSLLQNVVTNNAAAALLFPIAMNAAEQTGVSRLTMSYALMLGASASFMSPYGYTTNLLIFGPGGYRTMDFIKFGTPMQVVLWILSVIYLTVIKSWYISWVATGVCLFVIALSRVGAASMGSLWPRKNPRQESASDVDNR